MGDLSVFSADNDGVAALRTGPVQVEHVDSSHVLEMDVGAENKGTSKQRTSLAVAFKSGHIQVRLPTEWHPSCEGLVHGSDTMRLR